MKATVRLLNGAVIEAEGTPEEIRKLAEASVVETYPTMPSIPTWIYPLTVTPYPLYPNGGTISGTVTLEQDQQNVVLIAGQPFDPRSVTFAVPLSVSV